VYTISGGVANSLQQQHVTLPEMRASPLRIVTMAEVLVQFDEPLVAADGKEFVAHVLGCRTPAARWEAWIEFVPTGDGDPIRTGCETNQFTRGDLRYWAAGLSRDELSAALGRALAGGYVPPAPIPAFATLTPGYTEHMALDGSSIVPATPVLDPVELYMQRGEHALRQELRALDARSLRDIIAANAIPEMDTTDLARTFEDGLAERIVAGVQQRVEPPATPLPEARPNWPH